MPSHSCSPHHSTRTLSFKKRALLPSTPPLAAYLLQLIAIKRTNLCLSADVSTTSELLAIAEEVGDSICLLKTHADIVNDFGDKTVQRLREIAQRKRFLIFEDRKFGDIGSTVQKQYTAGPLRIAGWAEIVNCHIFPGPAIVIALKAAAASTVSSYNSRVHTEISVGTPIRTAATDSESDSDSDSDSDPESAVLSDDADDEKDRNKLQARREERKQSIVSISTTISTRTEPLSPQPTPGVDDDDSGAEDEARDKEGALERLGGIPFQRALLLLAEMSSAGNLLTGDYTRKCVQTARQHRDFVMGFVAQRSLNSDDGDNFVTMTPGVSLPPPGQEGRKMGDAPGQQYNTPRRAVYEEGCDVVIVGRGILSADDRRKEAERYRSEAWRAYEDRIGLRSHV